MCNRNLSARESFILPCYVNSLFSVLVCVIKLPKKKIKKSLSIDSITQLALNGLFNMGGTRYTVQGHQELCKGSLMLLFVTPVC